MKLENSLLGQNAGLLIGSTNGTHGWGSILLLLRQIQSLLSENWNEKIR